MGGKFSVAGKIIKTADGTVVCTCDTENRAVLIAQLLNGDAQGMKGKNGNVVFLCRED